MSWADKIRGGSSSSAPPPVTSDMPSLGESTNNKRRPQQQQQNTPAVPAPSNVAPAAAASSKAQQQQQVQKDSAASASSSSQQQPANNSFDYIIVLDFEATCQDGPRIKNQEVIELPSVLVDAKRAVVVAEFQRFVRPVHNPKLSDFCSNLTGIPQECVDEAPFFPQAFAEYQQWLAGCGFDASVNSSRFALCTCGDWDLKTCLPTQLRNPRTGTTPHVNWGNVGTTAPAFFQRWINLKHVYQRVAQRGIGGMHDMASVFNVKMLGHHHSGIDDCRNIARLLIALLRKGYPVDLTWGNLGEEEQRQKLLPNFKAPPPAEFPSSLAPLSAAAKQALERAQQQSKLAQEKMEAANSSNNNKRGQQQQPGPNTPVNSADAAAASSGGASNGGAAITALLGPLLDMDPTRDVVSELLSDKAANPQALLSAPNELMQVSKRLSSALRHNALQWRIPMSLNGWVKVKDLLRNNRFHQATPQQLAVLVATSDKQRFALGIGAADQELYVRANQGHSIDGLVVDMDKITDAAQSPVAVHGTHLAAWEKIRTMGLSRMGRQHVHFAAGLPGADGVISGMRARSQVLVYLDVKKALQAGLALYKSANGVILTAGIDGIVPPTLFEKAVDASTGRNLSF